MQTLAGHCGAWSAKFSGLLHTKAARELADLHAHFQTSIAALKRMPVDLAQVAATPLPPCLARARTH